MDDAERAFRDALHRVDSVKIPVPSLEPADVRRTPGLGIMMGRWLAAAAVVAVVAGLAVWALAGRGQAVTGVPASPSSAVAPAKLTGTTWIAVELYGKPSVFAGDKMPFIEFRTDSTYRGGDPCNGMGGSYRLVGNDLRVSPPGAMTERGCNVAQQQTFLRVLDDTRRVYRDGDTIELLDQAGSVVARFRSSEAHTQPTPTPVSTPSNPNLPTPSPSPAVVGIRIRNASGIDFERVEISFEAQRLTFAAIPGGKASGYKRTNKANYYAPVTVTTADVTYAVENRPSGGAPLRAGNYTYTLDIVDGTLTLAISETQR